MNRKTKIIILISIIFLLISGNSILAQSISQIGPLVREGKIHEAMNLLTRIEKYRGYSEPSDTLLFLRGILSTNTDSATVYYNQIIRSHPESNYCDDVLFRQAQMKYAQGLYKSSKKQFAMLLENYPQSPLHQKTHYWLGLCYQAMDSTESANYHMQIVIADYPYNELSDIARQQMKNRSSSTADDNQTQHQIVETQYYVQVGAFSRQNSALLRKSFFESKGYKVYLRTKWRDGKLLYLIWLGPGNTRDEARTLGENLRKKLDIKYIIVSE